MSSLRMKIRSFLKGFILSLVSFTLIVPFTTAVPTRDVTLDVQVKRITIEKTTTTTDGKESTSEKTIEEEMKPVNGKYLVKNGDEIILTINLVNPSKQKIISTRTWLTYDAKKMDGLKIDNTDSKFDLITPGENVFDPEFSPTESVVRLARASTTGEIEDMNIRVTEVRFKVISSRASDTTQIRFYYVQKNELAHTNALIMSGGLPYNVLTDREPSPISFVMNATSVPVDEVNEPAPGKTPPPVSSGNTPPVSTGTGALYGTYSSPLPTPKNIQVSTDDSSITVRWSDVQDQRVTSYFIYYTTHQNLYLHRKKVYGTSYTFSPLRTGDRYYFVLTAADSNDYESGYSPEVSVTVGQPSSIYVSQELSPDAVSSLDKLSKTSGTGPADTALVVALIISVMVYPCYKLLRKLTFSKI